MLHVHVHHRRSELLLIGVLLLHIAYQLLTERILRGHGRANSRQLSVDQLPCAFVVRLRGGFFQHAADLGAVALQIECVVDSQQWRVGSELRRTGQSKRYGRSVNLSTADSIRVLERDATYQPREVTYQARTAAVRLPMASSSAPDGSGKAGMFSWKTRLRLSSLLRSVSLNVTVDEGNCVGSCR